MIRQERILRPLTTISTHGMLSANHRRGALAARSPPDLSKLNLNLAPPVQICPLKEREY